MLLPTLCLEHLVQCTSSVQFTVVIQYTVYRPVHIWHTCGTYSSAHLEHIWHASQCTSGAHLARIPVHIWHTFQCTSGAHLINIWHTSGTYFSAHLAHIWNVFQCTSDKHLAHIWHIFQCTEAYLEHIPVHIWATSWVQCTPACSPVHFWCTRETPGGQGSFLGNQNLGQLHRYTTPPHCPTNS